MGLCRSLDGQQAPRYDGFTNQVPKRHNPSMCDTPKQLTAPVCGRPASLSAVYTCRRCCGYTRMSEMSH